MNHIDTFIIKYVNIGRAGNVLGKMLITRENYFILYLLYVNHMWMTVTIAGFLKCPVIANDGILGYWI